MTATYPMGRELLMSQAMAPTAEHSGLPQSGTVFVCFGYKYILYLLAYVKRAPQ